MTGTFLHQKVNTYLGIALISLMAFWTVLYYFTHTAEAIGNNLVADTSISESD